MKKRSIFLYIISIFFSISTLISSYIKRNGIEIFFKKFKFNWLFLAKVVGLSIAIFFIMNFIINKISKFNIHKSKKVFSNKLVFFISFISIFITGLLFLITFYPGECMVDTLHLLHDPVGFSFQYPLIYSLIFSSIYNFFLNLTNSMNLAFFLMSLVQLIFMSFILSYIIYWFHKKFKSNLCTIISILYFNIFSIFSNLNTANLRDTIFAAFILLLITLIYEIIESEGKILLNDKSSVKIIIVMGLLTLIRNNGIFTILLIMIYMIIKFKDYKKYILKIFVGVIVIFLIPKLLPSEYKREGLFQESVAVPIQQLAYTAKYESLDDDDTKYLNEIMDVTLMSNLYNPFCVDEIKWDLGFNRVYLNQTKKQFIKVWIKNYFKHFEGYTKAYVANTFDLWAINKFSAWESRFLGIEAYDMTVIVYFNKLYNKPVFPTTMQNKLVNFYNKNTKFLNNGTLFWIYILFSLILIYKNKKKYMIVILPFLCIWLNLMIASPLSSAFRYMCAFGYALPFIFCIVFTKLEDNVDKE